jgi:soluble lytic murein transglycosylase
MKYIFKFIKITIICLFLIIFSYYFIIVMNFFKFSKLILTYSEKNGLDPHFVAAVIQQESKFKKNAKSYKNASGLMQITEGTANWIADMIPIQNFKYVDIFQPEININIGTYYLKKLSNDYNNNMQFVLIAYNAGSGNLAKWVKNKDYSLDGTSIHTIPFKETREYVANIEKSQVKYKFIFKVLNKIKAIQY